MWVPGTPSIKLLEGSLLTFPPRARVAAPATCSAPRLPGRAPSLDHRHLPDSTLPGARPASWLWPEGSPLSSPGYPGCTWPSSWSWTPGPPRGARTVPPESLKEARARPKPLKPGQGFQAPQNPEIIARRSRVHTQQRLYPPARGRERAPSRAVRRCARAEVPARSLAAS